MVRAAAGAFVDDLEDGVLDWALWGGGRDCRAAYHGSDRLAVVGDCDTPAAVGGSGPVRVRKRSTVQTRWERVSAERAGAALDVASIVCGLAGE